MFKAVIVGKLDGHVVNMKSILLESKKFDVEILSTADSALGYLKSSDTELLLMRTEKFDAHTVDLVSKVKFLAAGLPLLVVAHHVSVPDFDKISMFKLTLVMQEPFVEQDFIWLCEKMAEKKEVCQRQFPRFYVEYEVSLDLQSSPLTMSTTMKNYSVGGACIQVRGGPDFEIGENLKMTVRFKDANHTRIFDSTIMWVEKQKMVGHRLVGLKFNKVQKRADSV